MHRRLRPLTTSLLLALDALTGVENAAAPQGWFVEEARYRRRIRRPLKRTLEINRDIEALSFTLIQRTPPAAVSTPLFRVHTTLAIRVLQDVRVAVIAAQNGYVMQSWTCASSAFEAANMMGFIAKDPARAELWLAHHKEEKSLAGVKDTIVATLTYLEIGSDAVARGEFVDQEYHFYRTLCMANTLTPFLKRIGTGSGLRRTTI
jgi:hypothetical protein